MDRSFKLSFIECMFLIVISLVLIKTTEEHSSKEYSTNVISVEDTPIVINENLTAKKNVLGDNDKVVHKWIKLQKILRNKTTAMYKNILSSIFKSSDDLDLSPECKLGLMKMMVGMEQFKLWAVQMFDSFGKIPNGILNGSPTSLGDYDECVNVNVPDHFRGQYCLLELVLPMPERQRFVPMDTEILEFKNITEPDSVFAELARIGRLFYFVNLRSSVCVPSVCSKEEVQNIANKALNMNEIEFDIKVSNCEIFQENIEFNITDIIIMVILGTLLLLAISSSIVDVYLKSTSEEENYQENLNSAIKYFLCFSFYTNTQRLLKPNSSADSIKIFEGMKVITMLWAMLGHISLFSYLGADSFVCNILYSYKNIFLQFITNGTHCVETFFFMSAVLHSYGAMKSNTEKMTFKFWSRRIFRRLCRLTPSLILVIACAFFMRHLGSGPVWKESFVKFVENCRRNWWTNILFINNFIPIDEMCLPWMWQIAADTQLYILCLIVLIPLKRYPQLAFTMNFVLLFTGMIATCVIHLYYNLPPMPILAYMNTEDIYYHLEIEHNSPHAHITTCCVGMTVGYFLARRPKKLNIPWKFNLTLWFAAVTLELGLIYGPYTWNQGNLPNMTISTLYACVKNLLWSVTLAWVTIACTLGNGGFVTDFLSWSAFVPLGRLTFMVYIIHIIIYRFFQGRTRIPISMDPFTMVYLYLGTVLLSFICAYGLSMLFEFPFLALEKLMFSKEANGKTNESNEQNVISKKIK